VFEGGHFGQYEFHPVVSKLQLYCSEDLGAFYLDVLKDRLYTSAPQSLARRSAQTALHHITHAMLRWMAPFLSFTAEEAWGMFGNSESIFLENFWNEFPPIRQQIKLHTRWHNLELIRKDTNKKLEELRAIGKIGASLQAEVDIYVGTSTFEMLKDMGEELKYILITSKATLHEDCSLDQTTVGRLKNLIETHSELFTDEELQAMQSSDTEGIRIEVKASSDTKCERCWHYRDDVGHDAAHPTLCGRCTSNLYGAGEVRHCA